VARRGECSSLGEALSPGAYIVPRHGESCKGKVGEPWLRPPPRAGGAGGAELLRACDVRVGGGSRH
jgi:hypothetical protein